MMTEEKAREIANELKSKRCPCEANYCQHREANGYLQRVEQEKTLLIDIVDEKNRIYKEMVRKRDEALEAADWLAKEVKWITGGRVEEALKSYRAARAKLDEEKA